MEVGRVGLSAKEVERWSWSRAVDLMLEARGFGRLPASIESEATEKIAKQVGRYPRMYPHACFVPLEIQQRDLTVAVGTGGGYLVSGNDIPRGSFAGAIRNASRVIELGATVFPAAKGSFGYPTFSTGATATWLDSESATITESTPVVDERPMAPKTVGALVDVSRQLVGQAPHVLDMVLPADLGAALGEAVDKAVLQGAGASGEPQGIVGASGVGTATGTSLNADALLELQTDVLQGKNSDGTLGYLTTTAVADLLAQRVRTSMQTPVWEGGIDRGTVIGQRAATTANCPASTMVFGEWSNVLIATWGVLEIGVDPFTAFKSGIITVRAFWTVDIALKHASRFSVAASIT